MSSAQRPFGRNYRTNPFSIPTRTKYNRLYPLKRTHWRAGRAVCGMGLPLRFEHCMKRRLTLKSSEASDGVFLAEFVTRCRAAIKKSNPPHRNFRLGAAKATGDNRLDSPVRSRSHDETPSQALCACTLFHARVLVGAGNPGSPGQNGGPRNRHQVRAKRRR